MSVKIIFEYSYKPKNYFEECLKIPREKYVIRISEDKITATTDSSIYDSDNELENTIDEDINGLFLGAQVHSHKPYDLRKGGMIRLHPNGRRDVSVNVQSGFLKIKGGPVDVKVTDKDGNVIEDTKAERVNSRLEFVQLAAEIAPVDPVAKALLESYKESVNDPKNELVHLYEIREALSAHFQGKNKVCKELKVSKKRWEHFGYLTNEAPLTQGRHRGKQLGKLRSAANDELNEARNFAKDLIHEYLIYSKKSYNSKKLKM